jgi:hypothetical protein
MRYKRVRKNFCTRRAVSTLSDLSPNEGQSEGVRRAGFGGARNEPVAELVSRALREFTHCQEGSCRVRLR